MVNVLRMIQNYMNTWGYRMCNCNEKINKKCPNRVCAYCDWHLELQAKEQECEKLKQWKKDAENLFKTQTDNADKIVNRYKQVLNKIKDICNTYQREYMVNNGVQLLTTKILQAIED